MPPPHIKHELETVLIPIASMVLTRIAEVIREYDGKVFSVDTPFGISFGITKNEIPITEQVPPVPPVQPPTVG